MKNIKIKYNPYLISTEITVEGQKPKPNSALNVGKKRLQEWVELLPQNLLEEYRDSNIELEFIGNTSDFEDVKAAFATIEDSLSVSYQFDKKSDITDVENEIDSIFEEIQKGPISELRDKSIVDAFEKAKNAQFEVSVVATMSSGKSTLINALLGEQLMPAANEATTATIVRIIDTEQDYFSAIAYDSNNELVEKIEKVTLEDMKRLNGDENVFKVELKGKIPFVETVGMKLVLVDTPGPNNACDTRHQEMTYRMVANSDKTLVLYVMNGQQLGINDEKIFLDYVCEKMKEGGKQGRERFIFAVNKMDAFKPKDEGEDCIERALTNVKRGLESRGIYNPNIFPISAGVALELRTDDDEPNILDTFKRNIQKYKALHFDNYYQFSNLPLLTHKRIEGILEKASEKEEVEVHSGIVSIEQAISQYINKYARPTKVYDLVQSFNEKLTELAAVANLEKAIREDKEIKVALEAQIATIKSYIQNAQNAQDRAKKVDNIKLIPDFEKCIDSYIKDINFKLSQMMSDSVKVEKRIAEQQCDALQKEAQSIIIKVKIEIEKTFKKTYKETIAKIVEEYKHYLSELELGVDTSALLFNPINLVSNSVTDLFSIIRTNTETVDESYFVTEEHLVKKEGNFIRKVGNFLSFGLIPSYTVETEYFERKISKYVDYVNMNEVTRDFIEPLQEGLKKMKLSAIKHIQDESVRLKEYLKEELVKIDNILIEKLDSLQKTETDAQIKATEIEQKEKDLKWLNSIQTRVNNIIHF
jgi:hypothetical protein